MFIWCSRGIARYCFMRPGFTLRRACTFVSKHCQYQALNCRKAMRLRVTHAATRCVASTRARHASCHLQATQTGPDAESEARVGVSCPPPFRRLRVNYRPLRCLRQVRVLCRRSHRAPLLAVILPKVEKGDMQPLTNMEWRSPDKLC